MPRKRCCGLAELRAAVVDGIGQAPDLNALRRVLRELFVKIELVRCPIRFKFDIFGWAQDGPTVENAGATCALDPYLRHEMLDESLAVRRAELRLDGELITKGLPS